MGCLFLIGIFDRQVEFQVFRFSDVPDVSKPTSYPSLVLTVPTSVSAFVGSRTAKNKQPLEKRGWRVETRVRTHCVVTFECDNQGTIHWFVLVVVPVLIDKLAFFALAYHSKPQQKLTAQLVRTPGGSSY